ncbi:MAG TPA: carbonic anhydrase [Elusimicrobiota bacterium]|nr:carbonic anhydrase [Elusimicrobiota bacterium]
MELFAYNVLVRKLIRGIVEFRSSAQPGYREKFAHLALGQMPDTLFIACSDSRVVPNLFASADPGDLFVVRNVGNLIPPAEGNGLSGSDESEAAAVEFSLEKLNVTDIIVCGHSECGAMQAVLAGRQSVDPPHLRSWLRHGEPAVEKLNRRQAPDASLARHNQLSQLNVLTQIDHLRSYPLVRRRIADGRLRLHGWWFELRNADVFAYEPGLSRFVLIDDDEAGSLLQRLQ